MQNVQREKGNGCTCGGRMMKLVQKHYRNCRHDKVASVIDAIVLERGKTQYDHTPKFVLESENTKILWYFKVQTDLEMEANKPDTVVMDKKEGKCLIIRQPVNTRDLWDSTNSSNAETSSYKSLEVSNYVLLYLTTKYLHLVLKSRGPRTSRSERNINCIYFDLNQVIAN